MLSDVSNQRAMTGLIRTVITKRQRRRFLHTIPDTKHDSDSSWSASVGGRQCWLMLAILWSHCRVMFVLVRQGVPVTTGSFLSVCKMLNNNRFVSLCV